MSNVERDYLNDHLAGLKAKTDPDLDDDVFFERFCGKQILKFRDIGPDEHPLGYTRGQRDGGVDSAYFFCDGKLVKDGMLPKEFEKANIPLNLILIQATMSPSFGEDAIRKFNDVANDLLDPTQDVDDPQHENTYNYELRTIIKRFRMWNRAFISNAQTPNLTITFHYATKGDRPDPEVEKRADKLKARVEQLYACKCRVRFVTAKDLLLMSRQKRSDPLELKYVKEFGSDVLGDAYVCLVLIKDFMTFVKAPDSDDRREYVLDPNVRGYLGSNDVNDKIAGTLQGAPVDDFWWLNNGVTIVASKVEPKTASNRYDLTRPRIVNGLQTSREIYNHGQKNKWQLADDPRHVLVKVIQAADKDVMNRVIKSTNSQTRIKAIYLHATEDVHFNIELAFPAYNLYYERVKNQYDDDKTPTGQIVTFPYLMKALMSVVLLEPNQARGRPDTFGEREYNRLFNDSYKPDRYVKAALLMKRVENYLTGHQPKIDRRDFNNIKYHVAMYAGCLLCKSSEYLGTKIGALRLDEKYQLVDATDKLLKKSLDHVLKEYNRLIKEKPPGQEHDNDPDQIAKGTDMAANLKKQIESEFPPHRIARAKTTAR